MSLDNTLADFIQRREQAQRSRRQHRITRVADGRPVYHWVDTDETATTAEVQIEHQRVRAEEIAVEKDFSAALAAQYLPRLSRDTQDQVFDAVWNLTTRLDGEDQFVAVAAEYAELSKLLNRVYDEGAAR